MAVPYVPTTHVDGQLFDAADANHLELGVRDSQLQYAVRVTHNATQSIPNSSDTVLNFNTERIDQFAGSASTMHDTVTNNSRLTALAAGVYLIVAQVEWASNSAGIRLVSIRLNGTTVIGRQRIVQAGTADSICNNTTTIYQLAVNDYVEAIVFQNSGGALNTVQSGNYSPEFMMARVA